LPKLAIAVSVTVKWDEGEGDVELDFDDDLQAVVATDEPHLVMPDPRAIATSDEVKVGRR
jgi:hypothetical protein